MDNGVCNKIREILILSQFEFWLDQDAKTVDELNTRKQRAIDYYLGVPLHGRELTPYPQTAFHHLIDMQTAYIIQALKGGDDDGCF